MKQFGVCLELFPAVCRSYLHLGVGSYLWRVLGGCAVRASNELTTAFGQVMQQMLSTSPRLPFELGLVDDPRPHPWSFVSQPVLPARRPF